jgi:FAD synthase
LDFFYAIIYLLDWFNESVGKKTYGDLIKEGHKEQKFKKTTNYKKEIAPQRDVIKY